MAEVKIEDHSDDYMKDVEGAIEKALTEIGIHLEGEAKEELSNTPKRIVLTCIQIFQEADQVVSSYISLENPD